MVEFEFSFNNNIPYSMYDMKYKESFEGLFMAIMKYINFSSFRIRKNEEEIFITRTSSKNSFSIIPEMIKRLDNIGMEYNSISLFSSLSNRDMFSIDTSKSYSRKSQGMSINKQGKNILRNNSYDMHYMLNTMLSRLLILYINKDVWLSIIKEASINELKSLINPIKNTVEYDGVNLFRSNNSDIYINSSKYIDKEECKADIFSNINSFSTSNANITIESSINVSKDKTEINAYNLTDMFVSGKIYDLYSEENNTVYNTINSAINTIDFMDDLEPITKINNSIDILDNILRIIENTKDANTTHSANYSIKSYIDTEVTNKVKSVDKNRNYIMEQLNEFCINYDIQLNFYNQDILINKFDIESNYFNNKELAYKYSNNIHFDIDNKFIDQYSKAIGLNRNDFVVKDNYKGIECNSMERINIEVRDIMDYHLPTSIQRELYDLQKVNKEIWVDKISKDIMYDKDYWVELYSPYHFKVLPGAIDELLLPHIDFDYEKFKTGLVDPITGLPNKIVTVIDSKTFICTYPVDNPLPEYFNIGNEYIDVDVELLLYLIDIYYTIWQKNIFNFGAMNLRDAVAKMMEYMKVFIDSRLPEVLIEQSYRILRLIRWYGEYGIMEKSEYKIHVKFDSLKSSMYLGTCAIPNTISNMAIHQTRYVLYNVDQNLDSYIELHLDNPTDTVVSFMVYLYGGLLNVIINNETVDSVLESKGKVEYNLTKGLNTVKLEFITSGGFINIAHIVIKDYIFNDIVTEFVPKVGTGNIILNEICKRIVIYADFLENSQDFVDDNIEGNIGICSTFDKLIDYFEKHHNRKYKGKRLVNKK